MRTYEVRESVSKDVPRWCVVERALGGKPLTVAMCDDEAMAQKIAALLAWQAQESGW